MIRRLNKNDHENCMNLLKTKSAENLFIIGDIEVYGYERAFQKLWGDFSENGELRAVLLKYEENYIPFSVNFFDAEGFAEIISNDPEVKMVSGLKECTEQILPHITKTLVRKRQSYYAKCSRLSISADSLDVSEVKQLSVNDVEEFVKLINSIPEFDGPNQTVDRKLRELKDGTSRTVFIEVDGKMVSTASTAAENSMSAMVVAVATLTPYKKRGYATKCMLKLCRELLQEGKELCLFYDNPTAGAIYKRIGFEDIGFWMMNRFG